MATEEAKELLLEAKRAVGQLKAEDAAAPAEKALQIFQKNSDQVGVAEALRLLLLAQMERGELRSEEALKKVKEEAAKLKRSARDGRRAEAMMQFTQAAVHLAKAEPVKAVQLAADAEIYFQREQDWPALAEVLEVVAPAHLQRGDGKKAGDAANLILDVAQKMKNSEVEARAWALVSAARFMAKSEDAAEAARKALDLYRQLRHRAGEAQTLIELAKGQLALQDSLSALATAREALKVAKEAGLVSQVGRAVEAIVEAQLQAGHPEKALEEAEEQLKPGSNKGTASTMSAIVVATAALRGAGAGLEKVKAFVEQLRSDGNKQGEVQMLHKLATMSPFPDYASNTAQAALKMAQQYGFPAEEKALKSTLTALCVAKGKIDKAPNRREALLLLQELSRTLEKKDGEGFDDANQNLAGYWMALTQSDVDAAMQKVITTNPPVYLEFLREHGANVDCGAPVATVVTAPQDIQGLGLRKQLKTGPKPYLYVNFRVGGISYGPRYRCCELPCGIPAEPGSAVGVLNLQDTSDDWERELQYNPSILDCALQNGAGQMFNQPITGPIPGVS